MSNESIILGIAAAYLIGMLVAPFPYWPTYARLWRVVLRTPGSSRAKWRQSVFLLKSAAGAPMWALLWYLDEILFPAYRDSQITPVFIVGQPRCGTTLLHRTLAADDKTCFAVRHLEWRYPFLSVQKLIRFFGLEKRLWNLNYWPDSEAGKVAARMHPNTLADWEEDGIFFEENYLHHFFLFLRFPYPDLLAHLDTFPELPEKAQERMLCTHRKLVQKVAYLRGSGHGFYLSKEVTSHKKIPALMRMYPEARFVVVLRSSNSFMASLIALMRMSTMSKTGVDPVEIPRWEETVTRRMQEDSGRLVRTCRDLIPHARQVRVSASDFLADIVGSVGIICHDLGFSMDGHFSQHLQNLQVRQTSRQRGYEYGSLSLQGFA